jgi:hypothetical protein
MAQDRAQKFGVVRGAADYVNFIARFTIRREIPSHVIPVSYAFTVIQT